jgi:hypothetical protein
MLPRYRGIDIILLFPTFCYFSFFAANKNPQVKMDQPTAPQMSLGMKPSASSTATRAELFAAIRSHVFGPNHERLSSLAKLHFLACNPSFNSDIFWTDDGKSIAINRVGYQRNIMNVFFDQSKFKSFQNLLSRYRFKTVRTINDYTGSTSTAVEVIIYYHPLFTREHVDIAAMMQLTDRKAMAQSIKMIVNPPEARPNNKKSIGNSYGAVGGQLQVLCTVKKDSAAGGLVQKNAVFEHNLYNDATLADSKQWLPLFHDLDIVTTNNAVCEDTIVNDEFSVDSMHLQQWVNVLDNDTTTDAFGCIWDF